MDYNKLANLLYPNCKHDMSFYLAKYPKRNLPVGAEVTRLGPSPTGYLHIGHLYSAMISRITATNTNGVFYLRLEDTDQKRYIPGAGDVAYNMLCYYGVKPDEGYRGDNQPQIGEYGDYVQSHRLEIYEAFAKELVLRGRAFPCFCGANESKEDILERRNQELLESDTITEHDEHCRALSYEEIKANIDAGKPWALKLLSTGDPEKQHEFVDQIKGKRQIRENAKDIVLVKSNGIPPYALAHVVDDTLMGTTTVVRGEEWYPSVAAHIETFLALGLKPPKYAHTPVISKLDAEGNKRKLSKRKDPEADVRFYIESGYPIESVKEYVLNLLNSDFEQWRNKNPNADMSEFPFAIKKIGSNNPMFDFDKLNNISKNVISKWSADRVFAELCDWANIYDKNYAKLLQNNKETMLKLLNIDRGGERPRKDIYAWNMVENLYAYVFEEFDLPQIDEKLNKRHAKEFLREYIAKYDEKLDKQAWFEQIKQIALANNFADNKDYKANPSAYAGSVADACTLVRVATTGRTATPDLCSIMQLLGKQKVTQRLAKFMNIL